MLKGRSLPVCIPLLCQESSMGLWAHYYGVKCDSWSHWIQIPVFFQMWLELCFLSNLASGVGWGGGEGCVCRWSVLHTSWLPVMVIFLGQMPCLILGMGVGVHYHFISGRYVLSQIWKSLQIGEVIVLTVLRG